MKAFLVSLFFILSLSLAETTKVIVIGAGVSGLKAAETLRNSNIEVTVLEARERIGGRVYTDDSFGYPIDLGGSWIHDTDTSVLTSLVTEKGIHTYEFNYENAKNYSTLLSESDFNSMITELPTMVSEYMTFYTKKVSDSTDDLSIAEVVDAFLKDKSYNDKQLALLKTYLMNEVEGDIGNKTELLSAKESGITELRRRFLQTERDDLLMKDGYINLFTDLTEGIDIKYSSEVSSITQKDNEVSVTTKAGTAYTADYVIVTVSLGVLKKKEITFDPALSEKKVEAIDLLGMGVYEKIAIEFEEVFWDDANVLQFFENPPTAFGYGVNFNKVLGKKTLVFLISGNGKYFPEYYTLSESEIQKTLVDYLKLIFPEASIVPKRSLITNWKNDQFSYGSYSSYAPGSTPTNRREFEENEGRVYFAGEHTSIENYASVDGAYLSGESTAKKIIDDSGEASNNGRSIKFAGLASVLIYLIMFE